MSVRGTRAPIAGEAKVGGDHLTAGHVTEYSTYVLSRKGTKKQHHSQYIHRRSTV